MGKAMKKVASLLLPLSLMLATTSGCATPRDAAQAVVSLTTPTGEAYCTGVAIKPQVVLTAEHCLHEGMLVNGLPVLEVIARDGNDHALIRTQAIHDHPTTVGHNARKGKSPKVGTKVEAYGHPAGLPVQYRRGYVTGLSPVSGEAKGIVDALNAIMYDLEGAGGDSGGPIFDRWGYVVATISVGYSDYSFGLMGSFPYQFSPEEWAAE